ncbi:MAG: phage holin family protein, partial [Solirubrobacterales bacterium]
AWREERLRFRPLHMVRTWLFSAIGLLVAAWIVPGAHINGFWAALLVAAVIAVAILIPSLGYLYKLVLTGRLDQEFHPIGASDPETRR